MHHHQRTYGIFLWTIDELLSCHTRFHVIQTHYHESIEPKGTQDTNRLVPHSRAGLGSRSCDINIQNKKNTQLIQSHSNKGRDHQLNSTFINML